MEKEKSLEIESLELLQRQFPDVVWLSPNSRNTLLFISSLCNCRLRVHFMDTFSRYIVCIISKEVAVDSLEIYLDGTVIPEDERTFAEFILETL